MGDDPYGVVYTQNPLISCPNLGDHFTHAQSAEFSMTIFVCLSVLRFHTGMTQLHLKSARGELNLPPINV